MLRRVLSMAAHAVAFERAIVTGAGSGIGRATAAALRDAASRCAAWAAARARCATRRRG